MSDIDTKNIICRSFTENDLKQIAIIEELSITPPWSLNAICEFATQQTSRILVAVCDNEVLGYITYSIVLDEVQIANVAVHPQRRRLGVAQKLLTTLSCHAKEDNMSFITLEVRVSNQPAIKLYEKCGYSEVGRRKNYYKNPSEDAILMNLNL